MSFTCLLGFLLCVGVRRGKVVLGSSWVGIKREGKIFIKLKFKNTWTYSTNGSGVLLMQADCIAVTLRPVGMRKPKSLS